jgi:WD40 repeat protein
MRQFARLLRRPPVALALLYLIGVGLLAWLLPPQPRLRFSAEDELPTLVGFSPDGRTLSTRAGIHVNSLPIETVEATTFRFWDVSTGRGWSPPPKIAERSSPLLWEWYYQQWCNDPGRRYVFWECALAPNPRRRLAEISRFPPIPADDADSPGPRGYFELSPDGRLAICQRGHDPEDRGDDYQVYDRDTGRRLLHIPAGVGNPTFGPGPSTVTLHERGPRPSDVIIRRLDVATGKELFRTRLANVDGEQASLSPDLHWLLVWQPAHEVGKWAVYGAESGQCRLVIADWEDCLFAREGQTLITTHRPADGRPARVQFWDLDTGQPSGEYRFGPQADYAPILHALSPDGKLLAVNADGPRPDPLADWPTLAGVLKDWGLRTESTEQYDLLLLDTVTGRLQARLPDGPIPSLATRDAEPKVAFTDDGRQLAVVGADGVVRIWDLPLRKPWGLILSLAAVPPASLGGLLVVRRRLRR